MLYFCLAPSYEDARRTALRTLSTEYHQSFAHLIDKYCALGPAADCAAFLQRYLDAGADHLTLIPAVPAAATLDQLRQAATEMFPSLRAAGSA